MKIDFGKFNFDDRYVNITGDTMQGDLYMSDGQGILFGTTGSNATAVLSATNDLGGYGNTSIWVQGATDEVAIIRHDGDIMTFGAGSITDSSGAIDFGNENLSTSGTLTLSAMGTAGFVKNSAAGLLSGGNTISVSDITDIATTYFKLDASNGPISETLTLTKGLVVNEGGGDNDFRVESVGRTSALFVQGSNGYVGVSTNSPDTSLHIGKSSSTHELRVETTSGSGAIYAGLSLKNPTETWLASIDGSLNAFNIGDSTNDSIVQIEPGAPSGSIHVTEDGNVVLGTLYDSVQNLHVYRTSGQALMRITTTATAKTALTIQNGVRTWEWANDSSGNMTFKDLSTGNYILSFAPDVPDLAFVVTTGEIFFNRGKDDIDFTHKGTTSDALFHIDAGDERIGILTATPQAVLDVVGDTRFGDSTTNYATFATDGELTLVGTARVEKCIDLGVEAFKAPGTNPADKEDLGISAVWAFDDTIQQYIETTIQIPNDMDRSVAPTLKAAWSAAATTGTAVWQLEYLYRSADEDVTAVAQETLTGTASPSGTANGLAEEEMTGIDLPSATDKIMLIKISRKTGDANDTMSGDAYLHDIQICYTSNKLGEAT